MVLLIQKMVNGGTVNNWICINFSRGVQESVARGFCQELAQMCYISGMVCFLIYTGLLYMSLVPKDSAEGFIYCIHLT